MLIAESKEDLEELMVMATEYSRQWRFSFNYDKCAVVIFNHKPKLNIVYGLHVWISLATRQEPDQTGISV